MSCENSRHSLFWKTAFHILTNPVNLAIYWISWHHLCFLCRYGRPSRNIPILALCFFWWVCAIGYGLWLWRRYEKGGCQVVFSRLLSQEKGLVLAATEGNDLTDSVLTETVKNDKGPAGEPIGVKAAVGQSIRWIPEGSIKWYIKRKHFCQLFLKEKEVVLLDLRKLTGEERDFLDVKLWAVRPFGKGAWRVAAGLLLAAVTLRGSWLVVDSALPYRGKLAWYLDDLKDKRTCALKHDNIYKWGIDGILEDVREKVHLPESLCLVNSFNLHFAPDGEILTFDTMLLGFDEEGDFVDSYLISYNRARSGKISIYLHGAAGSSYDESRSLDPLVEAVRVMPLRETVEEWEGEPCFGILYYGPRDWYSQEGIRLLNGDGTWQPPRYGESFFSGYSISVFCPENENLTPARYLWTRMPGGGRR